jgi:hypothetical protein
MSRARPRRGSLQVQYTFTCRGRRTDPASREVEARWPRPAQAMLDCVEAHAARSLYEVEPWPPRCGHRQRGGTR